MHRTVNHNISFVNPDTGENTNTIECTWRRVQSFLGSLQTAGGLRVPPRTLHVRGQGATSVCSLNSLPSRHQSTVLPALTPTGPSQAPRDFQRFVSEKQRHLARQVCARSHSGERRFRHASSSAYKHRGNSTVTDYWCALRHRKLVQSCGIIVGNTSHYSKGV